MLKMPLNYCPYGNQSQRVLHSMVYSFPFINPAQFLFDGLPLRQLLLLNLPDKAPQCQ